MRILAAISDLFVQSRIIELARKLGVKVNFVSSQNDLIREIGQESPSLVILDLASSEYDPFTYVKLLRTGSSSPKILAVFPHIRTDLKRRAEEAMIDYIVPNSAFLRKLTHILEQEVDGH
ncbi:MAG TPA: hypothetical protein VFE96_08780 [Candidatus Bathyarchaeia archaeon]|nr:hypothetical protein [Candidatus Bathyarchaeia archaeon]